jgi:phage terminase large subunit
MEILIPYEFKRLFDDDWREAAVFGGRYSLKSHTVARYLLIKAREKKTRVVCFREFQSSIAESSHQLLSDLIKLYELKDFRVTDNAIINTINGSDFLFKGLFNNEQTIKSIEGIDIAWCFPAGTDVDGKTIENIQVGDFVKSYNHKENKFEDRKVLKTTKRKAPKTLCRLLTRGGGRSIISTEEHPIFVKNKGYVPIIKIKKGDIIYEKIRVARNGSMFRGLWGNDSDKYSREKTEVCQKRWDILLGLCKENVISSYEKEQSNVQREINSENERVFKDNKTQAKRTWWKWKRLYNSSKYSLQEIRKGLVERVSSNHGGEKKNKQFTNKLQVRLGECLLYVGNRVRWFGSSRKAITNGRRKEKFILKERRVDSIEVQKQRDIEKLGLSDGGDYVYNIEVEVNNNFFANGLLVHNCEEAQSISKESLEVLTPTVRKPGSKIVYTYNRLLENDPVHQRLVVEGRPDTLIINVNYDIAEKYGWLPEVIKKEIEDDKLKRFVLYKQKWLGEPYISPNDLVSESSLVKCLSPIPNSQQGRVILGVDTGHDIHYTMANKEGLFYHKHILSIEEEGGTPGYDPYDELRRRLKEYPRSIIFADQAGDLIGIRKLQADFKGRVFLCYFTKETRSQELLKFGENEEFGKVSVDRNRWAQMVVDYIKEQRVTFNGTQEDWQPFFNHIMNIYRVKEIQGENEDDAQYGWRYVWRRKGPDHFFFSMLYAFIGLERFGEDLSVIVGKNNFLKGIPVASNEIWQISGGQISPKIIKYDIIRGEEFNG